MAECESEMTVGWLPVALHVNYTRDNRLGDVDHTAIAKAVEQLPAAFDRGIGSRKTCMYAPMFCIPAGFMLFAIGGFLTVAARNPSFVAVVGLGFLMFACGGMGGMILCGHVTQQGWQAVEQELGPLNARMSPINFSIRTSTHVSTSGVGSDRQRHVHKQYFLRVENLAAAGRPPAAAVGAVAQLLPRLRRPGGRVPLLRRVRQAAPVRPGPA
eukprot:CAMPEP_0179311874 /NCGR_PEP_ID=MMETSP0797-20121207/52930_1 /TAXON_ID=47934 /ORGANISM="Dinophysis acuminata, Strain DAEP01" /LENGTH=212 /DNA_ID=CAMNT_0021021699 /DNA_START=78 /DNA_END=712 /DNA_ORIENTATION=-